MNEVLEDLRWEACLIYIDDVVVFGKTFEEMCNNLRRVLKRFVAVGLRVKMKKCSFARNGIEYLGHVISNGTIRPSPEKHVERLFKVM
ncbi:Uncharacterised protein r2_g3911 [Pycnogonum litorale]